MKRLSVKLGLAGFFVMMVASSIPNLIWAIFNEGNRPNEITPGNILFAASVTVTFAILLYGLVLDRIIMRRIRRLSHATQSIMAGHYDIRLEERHQDELSVLTHHFNDMTHALQRNQYVNKEFVRNFSHEIKTPISTIQGYAQLLRQGNWTEEEQERYASIIVEETKRLNDLSKHMLLLSQVDHTVIVSDIQSFHITEQVRHILQLMQQDWEGTNLQLEFEDVTIESNQELTYHIFTNLITNAIRFSPPGSTITMKTQQAKDSFVFRITNPAQLTSEQIDHLFDLFYIAERSRYQKSNGIGLTLTKTIVSKLNGTIQVEPGQLEVTFVVTLPLKWQSTRAPSEETNTPLV
jgi:signal transduction histidine kinase